MRREHELLPLRLTTLTLGSKSPADGPSSNWLSRHFPWYQVEEGAEQPQMLTNSSLFPTTACGHVHTPAQTSRTKKRASAITIGYAPLTATLQILLVHANQLYSPHTTLQSAHLSRQRSLGFNRDSQRLDRTTARLLRDRHHRSSYGPPRALRSHGHYSAHVSRTHRPARRTGNRSIEFSFSHAFNSISRTMTVLTRYSSSTPFSFRKENYVTLQQENDGAFPRSLLTLLNVHPASSSCTRQHFDGYRAVPSIPTNRARISVVIACAAASDSPSSMRWEKDTAVTPLLGAQCRTSTHPTCSQAEPDVLPTDTNPTLMHRGRDTAVTPLLGAHGRTSTHPTCSQVEPAALSTASMGALCRTSTHPTCSQTERDVLPTDSLRDAQMLALAPALPNAHATSTALSPTRAAADGKP